jgi:adenine-specific DNA-methyltransferase
MPEFQFKGKEFVFNHHLSVPFRPLMPNKNKSIVGHDKELRLDGNLVIHGDNLHALKALLPMYANKVDCVFIDPPYNTGNESWCYNDNVNAPYIKDWLSSNPVNKDDMLRHDKWLTMMFPRLRLLQELMSSNGSIWVTIDDNEVHRLRCMLDDIFGEENFIANIVWHARESVQNDTDISTNNVNHIVGYAKNRRQINRRLKAANSSTWWNEDGFVFFPLDVDANRYDNPDNDPRGAWKADPFDAPGVRENLSYPIINPNTNEKYYPPAGRHWRMEEEKYKTALDDKRVIFGRTGNSRPQLKVFVSEKNEFGEIETNWWDGPATTTDGIKLLNKIIPGNAFDNPKPVELVQKILFHTTRSNSIILDSFAGSGTTAHAVMEINKADGGDRKFILVEGEEYADNLTAERVRRVIKGYEFEGTLKTELLSKTINFTSLKKADEILSQVKSIENLQGHEFSRITKSIKNDVLVVIGEKDVLEKTDGLGGSFTYCTLGDPINIETLLSGKGLPDFEQIGAWLFNTATNEAFDPSKIDEENFYLGESATYHVWLYYKPDLDYLKSREAALTLNKAETLHEKHPFNKSSKRNLVFAPAKFVANKALNQLGVEYAPLPFALFKIER